MAEHGSAPALCGPGETAVVISPHLDDAALSLGATIAGAARRGGRVLVLTVLAGDPASTEPAGRWDAGAGFATHGESARARRLEDTRACSILRATPVWLPYGDEQYARGGDDDAIWAAIVAESEGAQAALVPGSPLSHPDHAWLARLCLTRGLPWARLGIYAEQPYTWMVPGAVVGGAAGIADLVPAELAWRRRRHGARDLAARARACLAYRSQVRLLGHRATLRPIASDLKRGGEAVAWLPR
jgi:LmbE family N-acetylglucosaminyl deacetylase